jgi:ribose 5-phosphate isomerase B
MKILIASDHAGFGLKNKLIPFLNELGHEVVDMGPADYDIDDDYPDTVAPTAEEISKDPENARAIIIGGSGQGEAMVANRLPNVRAAVYYGEPHAVEGELSVIKLSREHNNSNVLSLGARFLTEEEAQKAIEEWLNTPYKVEERHQRRIEKLN